MKKVLFLAFAATIGFSGAAKASQVSCPQSIKLALQKAMNDRNMPKVSQISFADLETDRLVNLSLQIATVVHKGAPTASNWLIVVRPGPMGTCRPVAVYDSAIGAP